MSSIAEHVQESSERLFVTGNVYQAPFLSVNDVQSTSGNLAEGL